MCGFVGIVSANNETLYYQPLREMMNVIAHRGPDDSGIFEGQYARLGFRRLSIVDIEGGHQPMSYLDDRYTIIFNGEIYNAPELREQLIKMGASFQTHSDTEVILAAFHHYGEECLHRFKGMFAFLIWDREEERLFGARDPFGIKPLFYRTLRDGTYVFSSEKKSLFFVEEQAYIDGEAAFHYLTFQYIPEPNTATAQIDKVKPGHSVHWRPESGFSTRCYWKPEFVPKTSFGNKAVHFFTAPFKQKQLQLEKELFLTDIRETLVDSVKRHMRSDVPVGAFLSGGIDSSAIVSIARQFHPNLNTFTAEFEREGYSEGDVAEETARAIDVNHKRVKISVDDVMNEFSKIVWHMDEPVADPAAIPLYFVAREASKHVTVVLSGEGADEIFGGYNIYREPHSLRFFNGLPPFLKPVLRKAAERWLPVGMRGRSFLMRGCSPIEDRFVGNAKIFEDHEKERYLVPGSPTWKTSDITHSLYEETKNYDAVSKMQYIDLHTWLRGDILVKADKMTMAHSLELRVPFLDRDVFDVAAKMPLRGKVKGKQTKVWLRESLADIVPGHVLQRKKLGFPVPIRHWLKDEMYDWAKEWILHSHTDHIFDKKACLELLEDHRVGKLDGSRKIWTILTYMVWHHHYMENHHDSGQEYIHHIG
ncbi:asparagine synthase (glutamine-hydrolysing) [Evansella caseinilytica]|uniref:asparagine synthase (glutamine-hydrolyzing) n=1 Tax=Evansella caseinilytica TaxID=1503961 RepID=A0A1H3S7H4_9BACI|nr:asparagine synthase (glutamine-hydrolyzing) [Evansella caseinilytica]SDZ33976.1 asparagine synthase (glutamine-hydrolysing) [Evansella caseinilytica]